MLRDVVEFIEARSGYKRDVVLREINFAWRELWKTDDLPGSLFEISVQPVDDTARVTLPYFVDVIRGVKINAGRLRIDLFTPRPYYQDDTYFQTPYQWRLLGNSPLLTAIVNAAQLGFSTPEPINQNITISVEGTSDYADRDFEEVMLPAGQESVFTKRSWTNARSITKDIQTPGNINIVGQNGEDYGYIANDMFEAKNSIWQITDKCFAICNQCRCFDILFKRPCPLLTNLNTTVPFEEVLMQKTMEYIMLPKEGGETKAQLFGEKAKGLLQNLHGQENSIEKKLDLGRNKFTSRYYGFI